MTGPFSALRQFDRLESAGLRGIPLRPGSKVPAGRDWSGSWSPAAVRSTLLESPDCNLGLLLGDVVDVEGDSAEANRLILEMIGNYPHPTYRSRKSIHHLFRTPDRRLRRLQHRQIEFRGHGHQSALPPSVMPDSDYEWIHDNGLRVPPMPSRLLAYFHRHFRPPAQPRGGRTAVRVRTCGVCRIPRKGHAKRISDEAAVFAVSGLPWSCRRCRTHDLRRAVRLLRAGAPSSCVSAALDESRR